MKESEELQELKRNTLGLNEICYINGNIFINIKSFNINKNN